MTDGVRPLVSRLKVGATAFFSYSFSSKDMPVREGGFLHHIDSSFCSEVDGEATTYWAARAPFSSQQCLTLFKLENEVSLPPSCTPSDCVVYDPGPGRCACCKAFRSLNLGAIDTKPVPYPLAETEPQTLPSLSRVDRL